MMRTLWAIALLILALGGGHAEAAVCGAIPNTLVNGRVVDAANLNANFAAVNNCASTALQRVTAPTSAGAANAQTVAFPQAPNAYASGDSYSFVVGGGLTNTGAATINFNGRGATTIQYFGHALTGGELRAGYPVSVVFDGTNFQISSFTYPWTAQVHQNGGGDSYGGGGTGLPRVPVVSDQNADLIADHFTVQSADQSLITYLQLGGSITAGNVIGLNWVISGVTYQIRYTVQGGDTLAGIASNIGACISAGSGTNCTITSGFLAALLAYHDANGYGYKPTASSQGTRVVFDQPWAASGNSVAAFASGGATITGVIQAGNILDNGPYMALTRYVVGRTPVAGDQSGAFYFQGASTSASGIDTQYGQIFASVLVQDATNPQGEVVISAADATSAKTSYPKMYFGAGVMGTNATANKCAAYPGLGNFLTCGIAYSGQLGVGEYAMINAAGHISEVVNASGSGLLWLGPNVGGAGIQLDTDGAGSARVMGINHATNSFNALLLQASATTIKDGANTAANTDGSGNFVVPTYLYAAGKAVVGASAPLNVAHFAEVVGNTGNLWVGPSGGATGAQIDTDGAGVGRVLGINAATNAFNPLKVGSGSGSSYAYFDAAARVGINTTSPSYAFDVVGDINTSTIYRSGGTAGVSCGAGTLSTVTAVVTGGIITHC